MKIREFKKLVLKLRKNPSLVEEYSETVLSFTTQLSEKLAEDYKLNSELMQPLVKILDKFWDRIIYQHRYDEWQNIPLIHLWLNFQHSLQAAELLARDYHPLFTKLHDKANPPDHNLLEVNLLLKLLKSCCRSIGYTIPEASEHYPWQRLEEKIKGSISHEQEKAEDNISLLRIIFHLLYHRYTAEQLELIPYLIFYYPATTDEERKSEIAIFNWLYKNAPNCLEFFSKYDERVNGRIYNKYKEVLQPIWALIPTNRLTLIKETAKTHWLYLFIHKVRTQPLQNENDLFYEIKILLTANFSIQKDKSYTAALNFANAIKAHAKKLSVHETKILDVAIYSFLLGIYLTIDKNNFFSFWTNTKKAAAEKKQSEAMGKKFNYSLLESIALSEGRLNQIVQNYEPIDSTSLSIKIN
ncbi:MAG: hypothetical protein QM652_09420 [Legionella sp.]|uniref:hypothetical protein n=1 Tax=Legionella sp. TaxID=459 RepID=UPI0039E65789